MYQAHEQYYQSVPQDQRQNILSSITNALQNKGINAQQAGISPSDPSPQNLAKANQYIAQKPDLLNSLFQPGGLLHSTVAKAVMVGAVAYLGRNLIQGQRR